MVGHISLQQFGSRLPQCSDTENGQSLSCSLPVQWDDSRARKIVRIHLKAECRLVMFKSRAGFDMRKLSQEIAKGMKQDIFGWKSPQSSRS